MKGSSRFDEQLKAALAEYAEWEVSQLPSDEEIGRHDFSLRFERKMRRLIASEGKSYGFMVRTTGRRAVSVLVAVMLISTTMLFSVSATREPIVTFFTEAYEKFTAVFFDKPAGIAPYSDGNGIIDEIEIGYIPEGFELKSRKDSETYRRFEYSNSLGEYVVIKQGTFQNNSINIDTEDSEIENIYVNGHEGIYCRNKNYGKLFWNDNKNFFYIYGNIDKDKIFEIANGLKIN